MAEREVVRGPKAQEETRRDRKSTTHKNLDSDTGGSGRTLFPSSHSG